MGGLLISEHELDSWRGERLGSGPDKMAGLRRGCSEGGEGCASEEREVPCTWAPPCAAGWTLDEGQDRELLWGVQGAHDQGQGGTGGVGTAVASVGQHGDSEHDEGVTTGLRGTL